MTTRNVSSLGHAELIAELAACHRERARLDAFELELLAVLSAEPVPAHEKHYVKDEVASALRLSPSYVHGRFELAERLGDLPATAQALREGWLSLEHVRAITEATLGMDAETLRTYESSVLPYAQTHDAYDTRRKVKRELAKLDPFTVEERFMMGLEQRTVWSKKSDTDGLRFIGAELPSDGAAEVMRALAFVGETSGEDSRTKPQRMADALVQMARDVLTGGCSHCGLPTRPLGAAVHVTVALSTLLGLDEQDGELNGESIPGSVARFLSADENATWRRLVTDEMGTLVDYGRQSYRPPVGLRDHVVARDRTCRFPGCHRRAESCEIDHVVAWEDGGTTSADNLVALCPRHHHLKHEAGWKLRHLSDGGVEWSAPTGRTTVVEPASYPVDATAAPIVVANDNRLPTMSEADAWWLTYDEPDLLRWVMPDARIVVRNDNPPF
jgi:hypothetical protein